MCETCRVKNTDAVHVSNSSRCPVDCWCVYRGAAGGAAVERPGYSGADAWRQSVSTAAHRWMEALNITSDAFKELFLFTYDRHLSSFVTPVQFCCALLCLSHRVRLLTGNEVAGCCVHRAGGPWLITDMRRGETIFDIDPHLQVRL